MLAIYKREMRAYFTSPIGYVFVAIFLAISGAVFCGTTLFSGTSDMNVYFTIMVFVYIILLPLLTMKQFSEERKLRTEQLLMTAPVSIVGMVMGKYLATLTMFVGSLALTSLNILVLYDYSAPKTAVILGSLLAITLLGMSFLAIGLFVSSLTENQLASVVGTIGILLGLATCSLLGSLINFYPIRFVLSALSVFSRFQNFTQGVLDIASLIYYVSITAAFLFLTVRVYDKRRFG